MDYELLNGIPIIGKRKVEKIITIDKDGHVILPSEDFKNYICVSFDEFINSLDSSDFIYKDGNYKIRINNDDYLLELSNGIYKKEIDKIILSNKKKKIMKMYKDNKEYPVKEDEKELYGDYLYYLYDSSKANIKREALSILNNVEAAMAGIATGAIVYPSAKVNAWAYIVFVSALAISGGSILFAIPGHISYLKKDIKKKNNLKLKIENYEDYLGLSSK